MRMSMFDLTGYPHDRENVTQVQGKITINFILMKLQFKCIMVEKDISCFGGRVSELVQSGNKFKLH